MITLCGPHIVVQFLIIPFECWDSQYCWSWVSTRQNFRVCTRRKALVKSFNISHIFGIKNTNKYFFSFFFSSNFEFLFIEFVFLFKKKFLLQLLKCFARTFIGTKTSQFRSSASYCSKIEEKVQVQVVFSRDFPKIELFSGF